MAFVPYGFVCALYWPEFEFGARCFHGETQKTGKEQNPGKR